MKRSILFINFGLLAILLWSIVVYSAIEYGPAMLDRVFKPAPCACTCQVAR